MKPKKIAQLIQIHFDGKPHKLGNPGEHHLFLTNFELPNSRKLETPIAKMLPYITSIHVILVF